MRRPYNCLRVRCWAVSPDSGNRKKQYKKTTSEKHFQNWKGWNPFPFSLFIYTFPGRCTVVLRKAVNVYSFNIFDIVPTFSHIFSLLRDESSVDGFSTFFLGECLGAGGQDCWKRSRNIIKINFTSLTIQTAS